MIEFKKDKLDIKIYSSREAMGSAAAEEVISMINKLLSEKEELNMLFAAAPSQNEFLATLAADKSIAWNRVNAFHLDEYIGLDKDAPQRFGYFLEKSIFGKAPFKSVNYIDGQAKDFQAECERYTKLLQANTIDIACIGIGENGHIAFNDPHVADFKDSQAMKVVDLDMACRTQQVNDKCFVTLDDVPEYAFTLTIPTLMSVEHVFCMVPGINKSQAVYNTINGPIEEKCPASILREKEGCILYLDSDSASMLNEFRNEKVILK